MVRDPMRLHYHPLSPYARKVRVALLHRGDAHEARVVDVRAGEHRSPAYLELNPFGKLPILETDGGPLFESTSIIEYLEERGPRSLLPRGSEPVARHWDRLGDLYLMEPQSTIWWQPDTEAASEAEATAAAAWDLFDARLEGRDFLGAPMFTLADLSGAIATGYLQALGLEPPRRVLAWSERCHTIPAMATARDEGAAVFARALGGRAARRGQA